MLIRKPSQVNPGVDGVFTDAPLSMDNYVLELDGLDCRFVRDKDVPKEQRHLFEKFAVYTEKAEGEICGWWAPMDFDNMSIGWYLQHSKTPNLRTEDEGFSFYPVLHIQGTPKDPTELTCDFAELDDGYDNTPE